MPLQFAFFRIIRNKKPEHYKSVKNIGKTVWVNIKSGNVSLTKPPPSFLKSYTEHNVFYYERVPEKVRRIALEVV